MSHLPIITSEAPKSKEFQHRIDMMLMASSERTLRAKKFDFAVFQAWCKEHGHEPVIPSTEYIISQFLLEMSGEPIYDEQGKPVMDDFFPHIQAREQNLSVATVKRYLYTIRDVHDLYIEYLKEMGHTPDDSSTFQNPGRTKMVKDTMTGIVKLFRETKQKQAAPIRYKLVRRIIDELGDSKREILYKTLVSVAFDTLMRRSELVNIKVAHLEFDDLDGTVELPFSKTDQTGEGSRCYLSPTSVELIKSWLKVSGIRRGLLFRSLYNGDHKLLPSMNVDKVAKIFKEIGRRLELNPEEIKSISGHSTRVGAAQELMENGATLPQLMHAGDWKSAEMPIRYTQGVRARQSAVANLHRKMNDDKDSE